ncbi:GIY-YIG nuclease family protein [Asaia sp. As-1742]|uniref:GIY-YIG nuclease family protein n=1 Tax=Asaia sp. As-1742 TaxID=2608325 RepID=UPI00141E5112|nr:GIY-YIG nuclease family protein [Asaia sp. As-1742]NIE81587.1 GIY-YIG nuclease family protein [Asaia sp. As-1742]
MRNNQRKAAISAYKERKIAAGIFAIRCNPTGAVWVGKAPDLATIQNRIWFELRQGNSRHASLQQAWRDHGPEALSFEIIERREEEDVAYVRARLLQARLDHHAADLGAERL